MRPSDEKTSGTGTSSVVHDDGALLAHLAWCALVALHTAREDGVVHSPAQENLWLTRWLATVEKQRRFRRELAGDIRWLLREGRERGVSAGLPDKLEYLWRAGSGDLLAQSDLFRLQHILHAAGLAGWSYRFLGKSEWIAPRSKRPGASTQVISLYKEALSNGFDEAGRQTAPLPVRFAADAAALDVLMQRSGWRRVPGRADGPGLYHLVAMPGVSAP